MPGRDLTAVEHPVLEVPVALVPAHPASAMSQERTVLRRDHQLLRRAGEAAVGARPATVAPDDDHQSPGDQGSSVLLTGTSGGWRAWTVSMISALSMPCR